MPTGQPNGELYGLFCRDNNCVTVGTAYRQNSGNQSPLAYASNDAGRSWVLSSGFSLPPGQLHGLLSAVTCINRNCIAVGKSVVDTIHFLPLVYTSSDYGNHWTLSPPLPLPNNQISGLLTNVICDVNSCTALGGSLVYTSKDYGRNWILSSALPIPSGRQPALLYGIAIGER